MEQIKLVGTMEIMCAVLGSRVKDSAGFKRDPKRYIFSHMSHDIGSDISLEVVENGSDIVHLALPYYEMVDIFSSVNLADSEVAEISGGGEIIIALIAAAIAVAAGVGATGVGLLLSSDFGRRSLEAPPSDK